jgi:hypothetical protein
MVRKLVIGLMACGAIALSGSGLALAHDDDDAWGDQPAYESRAQTSLDVEGLAVWGDWVWEPAHGRVWRPRVDHEWRPYWRGHWAWQGGWVWVSADPWGDGPFHYGEWVWSSGFGWVWIPGTVWAPAHVTWIISGPVIAWAPASIHISIGRDPRFWVYADADRFHRRIVRPYRASPSRVHIRGGVVTEDIGRVAVPQPKLPRRELRLDSPRERTFTVNTERRVVSPRRNPDIRVPAQDAPRTPTRGRGMSRGFEQREGR